MKNAVILSCFGWYEKRIEPIRKIFIEKGFKVEVMLSDFRQLTKKPVEQKFKECFYIHVLPYKKNLSLKRLCSHYGFSRKALKYLNKIKPDLIYALVPPNSVAFICYKYKKKYPATKLVFDIIDLWPESMPIGKLKRTFPCTIWENMRNRSLKSANYIFTECSLYQEEIKEYITSSHDTLHLFKKYAQGEEELVKKCIYEKEARKNLITLGYVGSINHIIDIQNIVNIVKALKNKYGNVVINIIGDGEKRKFFLDKLEETGAIINYYGMIFDELEKISILAKCDYALNLMKNTVKVGLTIKSIDYFSYGLPIINNIKGDTWKIVEHEGIGINYEGDVNKLLGNIKYSNKDLHLKVLDCYKNYFTKKVFEKKIKKMLASL